jgi:hypothetical protein
MDMSDMLDVLHYYMEDDFRVSSAEQAEARDKARGVIYTSLYKKTYKFKNSEETYSQVTASGYDESVSDEDPLKGPTKSYIPPTDFNENSKNPFGDILDSPLGS